MAEIFEGRSGLIAAFGSSYRGMYGFVLIAELA
jgi:hypothetical protein